MGYEIAGALGVKLAAPEREVYAFLGDGSYLMLNHEIVTAVQEKLKITVVLTDNRGFGCIHNLQRACGGRSFGNEFRVRAGKSGRFEGDAGAGRFHGQRPQPGRDGVRRAHAEALRAALAAARAQKRASCLIYLPVTRRRPSCPASRGGTFRPPPCRKSPAFVPPAAPTNARESASDSFTDDCTSHFFRSRVELRRLSRRRESHHLEQRRFQRARGRRAARHHPRRDACRRFRRQRTRPRLPAHCRRARRRARAASSF